MDALIFKIDNKAQVAAAIAAAKANGVNVQARAEQDYLAIFDSFSGTYPYFGFSRSTETPTLVGHRESPTDKKVVSFGEFMEEVVAFTSRIVQLNSDYTALVTEDGIKIGQQTFDIKNVDELLRASLAKQGLKNGDTVTVKNDAQARALSILGKQMGYNLNNRASRADFKQLTFRDRTLYGSENTDVTKVITFETYIDRLMTSKNKQIELDHGYNAGINIDTEIVSIGCQKFRLDVFTELRAVYDEVTKK